MVLDGDGNFGIGVSLPSVKLEVNGSIYPHENAAFDLGSSSKAWDDVYAITYNDLTHAWDSSKFGSALVSIGNLKTTNGQIDHISYPKFTRAKHYVVPVEVEECEDNEGKMSVCKNITIQKAVEVNEDLSEAEQKQYVAEQLDVSISEVDGTPIVYTRKVGESLTMALEAIKELNEKIDELESRIATLEKS